MRVALDRVLRAHQHQWLDSAVVRPTGLAVIAGLPTGGLQVRATFPPLDVLQLKVGLLSSLLATVEQFYWMCRPLLVGAGVVFVPAHVLVRDVG